MPRNMLRNLVFIALITAPALLITARAEPYGPNTIIFGDSFISIPAEGV